MDDRFVGVRLQSNCAATSDMNRTSRCGTAALLTFPTPLIEFFATAFALKERNQHGNPAQSVFNNAGWNVHGFSKTSASAG
ncbi:hypothetical protein FIV00_04845 [Labrenzia sp. THAF82]|nr:hypothetical protein FIV00_04845 [Labrenzia sp. THAF82]